MTMNDYCKPRLPAGNVRKEIPLTTGLLDYFPDALAAVARVSQKGNQKHNPGEPLHWSRDKSADHADCVSRHLVDRGQLDDDGELHEVHLAWRALALAQEALEKLYNLPPSRGSSLPPPRTNLSGTDLDLRTPNVVLPDRYDDPLS